MQVQVEPVYKIKSIRCIECSSSKDKCTLYKEKSLHIAKTCDMLLYGFVVAIRCIFLASQTSSLWRVFAYAKRRRCRG